MHTLSQTRTTLITDWLNIFYISGPLWGVGDQDSLRCQDSRVQALRESKLLHWSGLWFLSFKKIQSCLLLLICPFQCIETDETAKKPDQMKMPQSSEEEREAIIQLEQAIGTDGVTPGTQTQKNEN